MPLSDAFSYFVTVVAIALAPGPCALVLLVRSARKDLVGALGFGFGYAVASVSIVAAVCFGLGAWLTAVPWFFDYSKYLMLAYILWLAWGIWHGAVDLKARDTEPQSSKWGAMTAGVLTCFISPYMMVLFPLVLPSLLNIQQIALPDFAIAATLTFGATSTGSLIIIVFAAQIGRLGRSEQSMRMLNRGLAGLLVFGGTWMAVG